MIKRKKTAAKHKRTNRSRFVLYLYPISIWMICVICCYLFFGKFNLSLPWLVLASLNTSTFFIYGFDKFFAQIGRFRIPEYALYAFTFLGGAIGAVVAMYVFRHKTRKYSFQGIVALLILIQLAVVIYFWK